MARQNSQFLAHQIVNYFVSVAKEDKAKTARYFMDAEVSQKKKETKRKHVYRIIQRYQNENKVEFIKNPGRTAIKHFRCFK